MSKLDPVSSYEAILLLLEMFWLEVEDLWSEYNFCLFILLTSIWRLAYYVFVHIVLLPSKLAKTVKLDKTHKLAE